MRVLVASASRHGSTHEVAERVAGELGVRGHDVQVREVIDVSTQDVERAQAVVLGSAVYEGRWQPAALNLARREADLLQARHVWLFSTGPLGADRATPPNADVGEVASDTGAIGHRVFGGRLQRDRLGWREKVSADLQGLPEGDHRDLGEIVAWADHVADELDRYEVADDRSGRPGT